jgi:hypothetical protein
MLPGEQPLSVPYTQKSSQIPGSDKPEYNVKLFLNLFSIYESVRSMVLSMHAFFPMVGMAARVSPMEQHLSRAAVQFALESQGCNDLAKKFTMNLVC